MCRTGTLSCLDFFGKSTSFPCWQASRVAVLRERLASAEGRAERAETMTREFEECKERIRVLEGEIKTWEETARQLPGVSGRGNLATKFEELQKEGLAARAKVSESGFATNQSGS
jgi:predicted nuclease with TOPRIM domain